MTLTSEERSFADQTVATHLGEPGALLSILERVQEHHPHKYLSIEILQYLAESTLIPLSQIYSVATFYALFNLEPQGEHSICICRGTACHTRGSRNLLQRLRLELNLPEETEDGQEFGEQDPSCGHQEAPGRSSWSSSPCEVKARQGKKLGKNHVCMFTGVAPPPNAYAASRTPPTRGDG